MALSIVNHVSKNVRFGLITSKLIQISVCGYQETRRHSKHWNPKFKWLRSKKVLKVTLPDFEELKKDPDEIPKDEIRSKLKENGVLPSYPWRERPVYISSTSAIFEPYVPPEGDGKVSAIYKEGAKQKLEFLEKKSKSMLAIRKVRSFDDDFEISDFIPVAQDIYLKAHEALVNFSKDEDKLLDYVTERAYPEMIHNVKNKTIRWKMLGSIEPPRVVHARSTSIISKDNYFSQITVRFFTQQILAVYDRFGRLMHGSEIVGKDVLEYIVYEKHLSNTHGTWRIHGKIIPDWMPPAENIPKTYRLIEPSPSLPAVEEKLPATTTSSSDTATVATS